MKQWSRDTTAFSYRTQKKNTHNRSSVCTHTKQSHAAHTAPDIDAYVMTVEMIV